MKLNWVPGRQNTGYHKILLCEAKWPIPFDVYLLRYNVGGHVPEHIDPVDTGKHFRLNIILKQAEEGGDFICPDAIYTSKWINLFRPDEALHEVLEVKKGHRYLFSIGWIW